MAPRSWLAAATVALAALAGAAAAGARVNDCAHPYWDDTLRCAVAPDDPPQPNLGDRPEPGDAIHPFTRVFFLRNPALRSVDGTYPAMYVDKAICTDDEGCGDAEQGEPIESDRWVISVQGGGSCAAEATTTPGVFDDAGRCLSEYLGGELLGMSTALDAPTKDLRGINLPDPEENPVFAGYNRILVEKSSADRFLGRATYEARGGYFTETHPTTGTVDFDLYQHGALIREETLRELRNGLRYETWVDDGEGGVESVRETLPALSDAEAVVLVGHSGGAHGLYHEADRLASMLEHWGGFDGDVRAVFDENFIPGIEAEARFAPPPGGHAYSGEWSGTSTNANQTFSYNGEAFHTSGIFATQYTAWGVPLDSSCVQAHATDGTTWKCVDRHHVLFNHVSTPFFLKQDLSDPNAEHLNGGAGHNVLWGTSCVGGPCPPVLTGDEFALRIGAQARTLIELSSSHSELATGADPGGGGFPTFYGWITNCGSHEGAYEDPQFFDTGIEYQGTTVSMREWLEEFVAAERAGATDWRIHGYPGADPMESDCPSESE